MNSIPIDPFSFILGAGIVIGIVWANQGRPWHLSQFLDTFKEEGKPDEQDNGTFHE